MTTKELLDFYYKGFAEKANWENVIAEDFQYIGGDMFNSTPVVGKQAYIEIIKRFSRVFESMSVKEMIIQGDKACVIGNYNFQFPNGKKINGNVSELWTIKDEKLQSLRIYFDTLTFARNTQAIMVDIIHRIGVRSPAAKVYKALSTIDGLAHWWTEEVEGDGRIGGEIAFTFRTQTGEIKGKMVMEVLELDPEKVVKWRCKEGPAEWIGTDITFSLSQQDDQTIILFGHRNWREAVEFTAHCSMKWAVFLLSLREYVETGKGKPQPYDLKIDNWN